MSLAKCFYAECECWRDDPRSDCIADIVIAATNQPEAERQLKERFRWTNDAERGWLCPTCSTKIAAKRTRDKTAKAKQRKTRSR